MAVTVAQHPAEYIRPGPGSRWSPAARRACSAPSWWRPRCPRSGTSTRASTPSSRRRPGPDQASATRRRGRAVRAATRSYCDRVSRSVLAPGSPLGLHRVAEPAGVLPQAAWRLDPSPAIWPDEVRVRVDRLNLDAASFRQLHEAAGGDPAVIRAAVLEIIASRGKMHNPVTGSGGMLTGIVEEAGPKSPLGLLPGDRIATLVSLSLTPLAVADGLSRWYGQSEQVPCDGHAILFGRSIAAVLPGDLPVPLALAVLDVCGAPALTHRVVTGAARRLAVANGALARGPVVAILGAAGRLADTVIIADARDPVAVAGAVQQAGGPADVTVVCVDVPGCEGGAILSTKQGGTVIFFSMATNFAAAALGAEGLAADVTMLVGNGYVPGHADFALDLIRTTPSVRRLFELRVGA